jgi:hypothetical protein
MRERLFTNLILRRARKAPVSKDGRRLEAGC